MQKESERYFTNNINDQATDIARFGVIFFDE
jgi:hypothetical protein